MNNDIAKLQQNPRQVAHWQKAQQQLVGGKPAAALANYRDLLKRFPGVPQLWAELGIAAVADLQFAAADDAFQRAETLAPKDVQLLVLLGQQYHRLRRLDRADACFRRAAAADPASTHAQLTWASWCERQRQFDEALATVESCLARHPGDAQTQCVRAQVLHRQGRNTEAQTILRDVIGGSSRDPNVLYSSRQLLGTVLDALGNHAEAMRWLLEAKAQLRLTAPVAKMEENYDRADDYRRKLLAALPRESIEQWRRERIAVADQKPLALLGGHPRSGTTLLEQILGAHPRVLALDESEAFAQEIWEQLAPMQAARPLTAPELNGLAPGRRDEMTSRYYRSLLRESPGPVQADLLLDKNPSPTAALHLWLRLFPHSKVIIALRDPRDVVISCFFQNLTLTPTNVNFLSLERAVRHYSDLMDVWLRLRELGGFDWIESRYEDVVNDVETEGRRVTEFVGLKWHPDQANHREITAQKVLFAPTFSDVAKPVHTRAVGRWQHYAEALAPVQNLLAPYCRALGYFKE